MLVKTNVAGYELYGLIGEANGQALPLGFIFTTMTDGSAKKGAKEHILDCFLPWFVKGCPNVKITGSDKDPSKINSCCKQVPDAKHQLCYWHAIKYIEECLSENKPPAAYNATCANCTFDFIDPTWVPGVTRGNVEEYLDGRDIEDGADMQGGTRTSILDIGKVSQCSIIMI